MTVDSGRDDARIRRRIARALGDYWWNGAGPTHDSLNGVFDDLALEIESNGKRNRVSEAVVAVPSELLFELIGALVDLLGDDGYLATDLDHSKLSRALASNGWRIENGHLVGNGQIGVDPDQVPDVPAVREHILRIQRALKDEDDPQLIGSSKELLESVAKLVVASQDEQLPGKFPALVGRALEILRLHPKAPPVVQQDLVAPVRKVLQGALQIALGVNDLRRDYGTGHGRLDVAVPLERRHARLAAGASVVVATLMLDTYEDPKAPWRLVSDQ